jgi:hypothetical protein
MKGKDDHALVSASRELSTLLEEMETKASGGKDD